MSHVVTMVADSPIGEFDYGPFRGYANREPARPAKWDEGLKMLLAARPEHWSIKVDGTEGAWREVRLPLKRGRTMKSAIAEACDHFGSPDKIQPSESGWFGASIDLA